MRSPKYSPSFEIFRRIPTLGSLALVPILLMGCAPQGAMDSQGDVASAPQYPEAPQTIYQAQTGSDAGFIPSKVAGAILVRGIASLGSPGIPGVWVQSPDLTDGSTVEIHDPAGGTSVLGTARSGAGALQLSLAGYQALGLSPVSLPEIEVRTP